MKKTWLLTVALILSLLSYSQGEIKKQRTLNDKIFFGGGIGLQFGSYTGIEISPVIGYKPIDNLYTGLKLTYQYYGGSNTDWSQNVWGGSVFAEYVLLDRFVGHAEYEQLYVKESYDSGVASYEFWVETPLIGGGIYQKI
ncbi:MAG: hypothetical protein GY793_11690, partial [Proteobacteria bacterium]|nr:hypothetical protein [Pseudomonadota bacterium]